MTSPRPTTGRVARHAEPGVLRSGIVALVLSVLALVLADVVSPWLDTYTVLPSILATIAAAWYGGFAAGLLATAMSLLGMNLLFIGPRWSFETDMGTSDAVRFVFFVLAALGASAASGSLRAARRVAERALVELEEANATLQQQALELELNNVQLQEQQVELEATMQQLQEQAVELEHHAEQQAATARQLRAANEELAATTYSIAHDLRSPLRAVDGYARILELEHGPRLDDEARQLIGRVRGGAQRMGALIDGILALARVGRGELRPVDVDVSALAEGALEDLRRAEPARRVDATVAPGIRAWGDERLLAVVVQNLLGNAWKFTRGRAHARVAVVPVPAADGMTAFEVQDDGVGFDPRFAGQLFQSFHRLHGAADFEGHGIGLATVRRIVERHGGHVHGEGRPGDGATFHVALPAAPGTPTRDAPRSR